MKIQFGQMYNGSRADLAVTTDGRTETEIVTGDQHDHSFIRTTVYDLSALERIDPNILVAELQRLGVELHARAITPEQIAAAFNIDSAVTSATRGAPEETSALLSRAGKWALDTATIIGTPVAEAALKAVLGL